MAITQAVAVFLDIDEAANFLRVKRGTLYAWVHQQRIPFRKHGRRVVFSRSELERWSENQAILPVQCRAPSRNAPFGVSVRGRKRASRSLKIGDTVERGQNSLFKKGE